MTTLPEFISAALAGPSRARAFGERWGPRAGAGSPRRRCSSGARAIAAALRAAGIEPGDRVALIANNRIDWIAADFGTFFAGGVVVPIFATLADDQIDYIFRDSGAKLAFVESAADVARFRARCPAAPRLIHFDDAGSDSLAVFEASGAAGTATGTPAATPDALAVLIYTSGTTGDPKGVMLSHRNLISNAEAGFAMMPASLREAQDQAVLSVLPFAHIYEHTLIKYLHEHARGSGDYAAGVLAPRSQRDQARRDGARAAHPRARARRHRREGQSGGRP